MRLRICTGLALCCFIACGQSLGAPASIRSLSLAECLDLGLACNLDLQIEHLNAKIAAFDLSGSYGAYDPTFSFQARHDVVSQSADFDPKKSGLDFPYDLSADTLESALNGRVPYGLSYGFNGTFGGKEARTDFNANTNTASSFFFGIRQTNNYFADAGLTARQHLLRDFWIDQDMTTIRLRRKDLKISEQALRFQVMKTALAVELAYDDLIVARENVRVQDQTLNLRRQLVSETRRRVEVGDLPPLDSEQAETQLQNTLTALAAARETLAARQNTLKHLLTDDFNAWADVEIEPADALLAVPAEASRSASFFNAMKNRPDLIEARLEVEKNNVLVKFRFNQLFPSLDLIGSYGAQSVEADAGTALSDAAHLRGPSYYYGVVLGFPLGNITERSRYRASKAAKEIAQLQLKKAEQDVLFDVADLVNRVQSRFSQVGSTHKARTYAESALSAEQKKLQNGLSTSFIVLQLQETLTAARTAEILALADYNKLLAQLAFAEGSILEKHRLRVDLR